MQKFVIFCYVLCYFNRLSVNGHHLLHHYYRTDPVCEPPKICTDLAKCPSFALSLGSFCGLVNFVPQVCCSESAEEDEHEPSSASSAEVDETSVGDDIYNHRNFKILPLDICGLISDDFRITGGLNSAPAEFPWMVLIAYKTGGHQEDLSFRCGGSLISRRYVLTAAHCIDKSILGVRLGEYNLASTSKNCGENCNAPVQDVLINKITTHPQYDDRNFFNDISLIRLATPADFNSDNVKPICLPFGQLLNMNLTGRSLTVAGWGVTETGDRSDILRKVSIPVIPMDECKKIYETLMPISPNQICAGSGEGKDSCAGDSGCPLKYIEIINQSPRYVQYGIVSYGPRHCGNDTRPGVYTKIPNYMAWILDNIDE